jgi:hypothetical protein
MGQHVIQSEALARPLKHRPRGQAHGRARRLFEGQAGKPAAAKPGSRNLIDAPPPAWAAST